MVDFNRFVNELDAIGNTGRHNVTPKLKPVKPKTVNLQMPGGNFSSTGGGGGSSQLSKLMSAIKGQESNNNYGAVNSMSGAAGAYQIMPANIGPWSREALGRSVNYNQFMSSRQLQDTIAKHKLNQYLKQYGAAGAAVAWYGGPGAVKNMHSTKPQAGGHPSIAAYWQSVLNRM